MFGSNPEVITLKSHNSCMAEDGIYFPYTELEIACRNSSGQCSVRVHS